MYKINNKKKSKLGKFMIRGEKKHYHRICSPVIEKYFQKTGSDQYISTQQPIFCVQMHRNNCCFGNENQWRTLYSSNMAEEIYWSMATAARTTENKELYGHVLNSILSDGPVPFTLAYTLDGGVTWIESIGIEARKLQFSTLDKDISRSGYSTMQTERYSFNESVQMVPRSQTGVMIELRRDRNAGSYPIDRFADRQPRFGVEIGYVDQGDRIDERLGLHADFLKDIEVVFKVRNGMHSESFVLSHYQSHNARGEVHCVCASKAIEIFEDLLLSVLPNVSANRKWRLTFAGYSLFECVQNTNENVHQMNNGGENRADTRWVQQSRLEEENRFGNIDDSMEREHGGMEVQLSNQTQFKPAIVHHHPPPHQLQWPCHVIQHQPHYHHQYGTPMKPPFPCTQSVPPTMMHDGSQMDGGRGRETTQSALRNHVINSGDLLDSEYSTRMSMGLEGLHPQKCSHAPPLTFDGVQICPSEFMLDQNTDPPPVAPINSDPFAERSPLMLPIPQWPIDNVRDIADYTNGIKQESSPRSISEVPSLVEISEETNHFQSNLTAFNSGCTQSSTVRSLNGANGNASNIFGAPSGQRPEGVQYAMGADDPERALGMQDSDNPFQSMSPRKRRRVV